MTVFWLTRDDGLLAKEAGVRAELREPLADEVGEERALPAAASLRHAVDRLVDPVDVILAVLVLLLVARWAGAVVGLVGLEVTLKV